MGTRSRIGIEIEPNKFVSIYCHWDGYPSHNGNILLNHYQNIDKVLELMSLGDLSILGPEIGEKHDFDSKNDNWCCSYSRDRNETDVAAKTHSNISNLCLEEYAYLYRNNKWYFWDGNSDGFSLLLPENCA